jgi:hypothetical protein
MTAVVTRLAEAEAQAIVARERFARSAAALQERLEPRRLARDAAREMRQAGEDAARRTADGARRNPRALAGVVAVAGLFLARHRIASLFRRRKATGDDPAS